MAILGLPYFEHDSKILEDMDPTLLLLLSLLSFSQSRVLSPVGRGGLRNGDFLLVLRFLVGCCYVAVECMRFVVAGFKFEGSNLFAHRSYTPVKVLRSTLFYVTLEVIGDSTPKTELR